MTFRLIQPILLRVVYGLQQVLYALFALVALPLGSGGGFVARIRVLGDRRLNAANLLDKALALQGDRIVLYPETPMDYASLPSRGITVRQIHDFVCRAANVLKTEAKVRRWDRVGIIKSDEPDYFLLCAAVIRAGGVAVPIASGMKLRELEYYLKHTGATVLITDQATLENNGIGGPESLPMIRHFVFPKAPTTFSAPHTDLDRALSAASPICEPPRLFSDSHVMLVHTSGTTGFPKAVIYTSESLTNGIKAPIARVPMTTDNRVLAPLPNNHGITYQLMALVCLGGFPIFMTYARTGKALLEIIQREKITIYLGFPVTYLRMYLEGLDNYDLSSVRVWMNCADSAHETHMRAFARQGALLQIFGVRILGSVFVDTFGSSEVGSAGLYRYVFGTTRHFDRCVGRPSAAGVQMKVADEHGNWVSPNRIGRLMVRGFSVFRGYWNAHERLHGVVHDGWWWTGDVVYYDWLGRYHQLDRDADTIRTPTGPVYSLLAEEVLMKHPQVGEAACIGVPDDEGHQRAVCVVYPKPGQALDREECLQWIGANLKSPADLSTQMIISDIIVVTPEEIPLGLTGKVLKRQLREHLRDRALTANPAAIDQAEPPRSQARA